MSDDNIINTVNAFKSDGIEDTNEDCEAMHRFASGATWREIDAENTTEHDTDTRVNWREIDTTTEAGRRALDVEIARRLGWTVYAYCSNFKDYFILIATDWRSYTPEQRQYAIKLGGDFAKRTSEHEAWLDCQEYTSDLNAAASLSYTDDYWLQVSLSPDGDAIAYARVLHNYSSGHGAIRGQDKSEAVARCKAWLAWHDAKSDKLSASDTDESEDA